METLLRDQRRALGRPLRPGRVLRRTLHRREAGRPDLEIVRRIALPDRIRDDVAASGAWRYSESFDGSRAWAREAEGTVRSEMKGRARATLHWYGVRLDYLRALDGMRAFGCALEDLGVQSTADGRRLRAIRVALADELAETVFLDARSLVAGYRMEPPPAASGEEVLELRIEDWSETEGLVHPLRASVLDRASGLAIAEIRAVEAGTEVLDPNVFSLLTG